MITKEERSVIIKTLGSKYVKKIQNYLIKNSILSVRKTVYSKTYISYILSGKRENEAIENAIFVFTHLKTLENQKNQKLRDQLMNSQQKNLSPLNKTNIPL